MQLDAHGNEVLLPPASNDSEQERRLDQIDLLQLTFYKGSHAAPLRRRVKVKGGIQSISWNEVKMQLIMELGLAPEGNYDKAYSLLDPFHPCQILSKYLTIMPVFRRTTTATMGSVYPIGQQACW